MAIYNKTTWTNNITPLNQDNMNHIEEGIYTISEESYAVCSASYSEDVLEFIFKNAGNQQVGSAITVNIPTGTLLTSVSYNTSTNQLSYTDRNGSTTNIVKIYDITKVYNKTEIDTTLANYYTKSEIDTTLASYYTKSEIDTTLAGYYLKTEIDALLAANYYTKSEINNLLNNYYTKQYTNNCFEEIEIEED